MKPERLNPHVETQQRVAPYPAGIEAYPAENGINTVGMTAPQMEQAYRAVGSAAIDLCRSATPLEKRPGSIPYSETRAEDQLGDMAEAVTTQTHAQEGALLVDMRDRSMHPDTAHAAGQTLQDGIDPAQRDRYYENQRKIDGLERSGHLDKTQKNYLKALRQEQRQILRQHSDSTKFSRTRSYYRTKKEISARKGAELLGRSEEATETVAEGYGKTNLFLLGIPGLQDRQSAQERKRDKGERAETRNIVSTKGFIITVNGRRHVVSDTISTPAQAHKIIGRRPKDTNIPPRWKENDPIYETHASGDLVLHPMYLPLLDANKKPKRDPVTRSILLDTSKPIPRDNSYRSGADKTSGDYLKGPFYYADGTAIHSEAWGADSFDPIDDIVVLKPLLTGEEAIKALVKGRLSGIDLDDTHLTLGALCALADEHPELIESKKDRDRILETHLVFAESDSSTPGGVRPPHDERLRTGHFERFYYHDERTSRERSVAAWLQGYARERISDGTKKTRGNRASRFSG